MNLTLTPEEVVRFYAKIQTGEGCHLWQSETNNKGYGRFNVYRAGKRVRLLAHRLAFELATGIDPGTAVVRHTCDTPACCNAEHHVIGTQADNIHDAVQRGRMNTEGLQERRQANSAAVLLRLKSETKQCSRCKETKQLDDFARASAKADGRAYWCKACISKHQAMTKKNKGAGGMSERERRKLKRTAAAAELAEAS